MEDRKTAGSKETRGETPLTFLTVFCKAGGKKRQKQRKEGKSEKTRALRLWSIPKMNNTSSFCRVN